MATWKDQKKHFTGIMWNVLEKTPKDSLYRFPDFCSIYIKWIMGKRK